ncbi:MAG: aldo/keto reductase [Alphaproteobacteria bacterium]|nr:aldo/keto reductase [Alphaproteobacteria bacterium]
MKYVRLGDSGLEVSAICIGGNSWGARGRRSWAPFDETDSAPFFRRALDCGINFFDTADAYNLGESERILGKTLMGYAPRDELVISTKVGLPMGDGPNQSGLGRKHLLKSIDQQLRRLKTDYVDVYQVHRLDGKTPLEETLETLTDIVKAGKVRYIGGSTMPAYKFAQILTLAACNGYAKPIAMQNLYNLIQREEEREMIPLCLESGVGLIPYSPLARGILAGNRQGSGAGETERANKDTKADETLFRPSDRKIVRAIVSIAERHGAKPTQVALAWMLSKSVMAAPIIGTTKLDQIDDAAAAVNVVLSDADIARLEKPYQFRAG